MFRTPQLAKEAEIVSPKQMTDEESKEFLESSGDVDFVKRDGFIAS